MKLLTKIKCHKITEITNESYKQPVYLKLHLKLIIHVDSKMQHFLNHASYIQNQRSRTVNVNLIVKNVNKVI